MALFTERAIQESFIRLLNERPLDKITIKDIAEDCGINRNTFYYHYEDLHALLVHILNAESQRVLAGHIDMESWEDGFISAAQFALENKRLVYHIYNSVRREEVERYLNNIAAGVMRQYVNTVSEHIAVREEDKELIVNFYRAALVGMIVDWLNAGMKYDPVELIRRTGVMLRGNIESALERMKQEN